MKQFNILKDRYVLGYCSLYLLTLLFLGLFENYDISEAVAVAVIFGLFLPTVAYWSCRFCQPLNAVKDASKQQIIHLVIWLLVIVVWLTLGPSRMVDTLGITTETPRLYELVNLSSKLFFFVIVPGMILLYKFDFTVRDFGFDFEFRKWLDKRQIRPLIILIPLMTLFQLIIGQGAESIRSGNYSATQLLIGLPLTFAWLLLNVGLVEEFFFRAVLQSRISAYSNSETAGILISALLFGLVHAPGLYLRGAGANSAIGADPSLLLSIGHSIVVLSAAGIFMGLVWSRTRNLFLVMLIHASIDLLPGFSKFVSTWKLIP